MMKFLISCLLLLLNFTINAKILHSERSLYRNISVEESDNKRCMIFGRLSRHPDYQSCINTNKPDYLVFSYTKLVMAGLSIIPKPTSILIIGLGGGTLPLSIEKIYPDSIIETVEIDPAVVRVAKEWFDYKEKNTQKVYVLDGRVYVKRQLRLQKQYDLIILDAFNGDYIPEHLMTKEFLTEVKLLLNPKGLLIANTFSDNQLFHNESVTYQSVFGDISYISSQKSANRVIFANRSEQKIELSIKMNQSMINKLTAIGVDLYALERLSNIPDWDIDARILTDQYSPVNLLNQ